MGGWGTPDRRVAGAGATSCEGCAEAGDQIRSRIEDVFPAEVHELYSPIAQSLVPPIAAAQLPASFLGALTVVLRKTVGLTDRPELWPPEVHTFRHPRSAIPELGLEGRQGQAGKGEDCSGYRLEHRLRPRIAEADRVPRPTDSRPLELPLHHAFEITDGDAAAQCVVDGHDRLAERQGASEIHHGPRRAGDRQPQVPRHIGRVQGCTPYDDVLAALVPLRRGRPCQPDGGGRRRRPTAAVRPGAQPREACRAEVTDNRAWVQCLRASCPCHLLVQATVDVVPVVVLQNLPPQEASQVGVSQSGREKNLPVSRRPSELQQSMPNVLSQPIHPARMRHNPSPARRTSRPAVDNSPRRTSPNLAEPRRSDFEKPPTTNRRRGWLVASQSWILGWGRWPGCGAAWGEHLFFGYVRTQGGVTTAGLEPCSPSVAPRTS